MKHHSLFRRLLSVLLCLTMIFSLFPVSVFAEGVGETEQGDNDSVNLKIDYVSEDGAALAEAYNVSVAKGAAFEGTVPFASVEGYRPAKVEFGAVNAANALGEEGVISVYGECANVLVTENGMVLSGAAEADVYVIVTYVALAAVEEQPAEEQPSAEDEIKDAVKDALGTDTLALDDYGVSPLADKGSKTLVEGQTIQLKSDYSNWSSSDTKVATVDNRGNVTAIKAGTATIYAKWRSNSIYYYDYWTVTVTEAEPTADTTTVYVYIRVGGNTDSISLPALNKDGWFTIGKMQVPATVLPAATENSPYATDKNAEAVAAYVKTSLQPYPDTAGIFDLTNVKWTGSHTAANGTMTAGLKTPTGATGYNDETGDNICWHLDGYLEIVEKHDLTVNYEFAQGSESSSVTLPESYTKSLPTGATETIRVPNYDGFTVAVTENGAPCHDTVTMGNKDRTVTVTYTRNTYTVVGTIDNGTVNGEASGDRLEVDYDKNASLSFKAAEGYKIVSVTVNDEPQTDVAGLTEYTYNNTSVTGDVTVAVTTEIDNSQTKPLSYTVEYYKDGVKVEGDTQTETVSDVWVNAPDTLTVDSSKINTTDKYTGYKFDSEKTGTIPETVNNGTVIKVYYTARTDLSYTVRYLEKDTNNVLATAKTVNNQKFGSTVTENAIEVEGYNKVDPTSATITIKETGNEINFYYVKRNNLSYTVNHYLVNGTEETLYKTEVVNNQTFGKVITSAKEAITISGYSFDHADKDTLTVGTKTEENVINLYYNINTYTVKYVIEGDVGAADPYGTVESYDYNTEVTVAGAPEAKYGYSFSGWKTNDVSVSAAGKFNATKNVVFTGSYKVDDSQTKNLTATVDYKLGDEVQTDAHIDLTATVQVLEPDTLSTAGVPAKNFTGWKLEKITINGEVVEKLPETVNNGDEVVYNYVKDESKTQDTKYTVKHVTVLNGVETEQIADTREYTGKAWINDKPAMIAVDKSSLAQKSYKGYIFSSISVDEDVTEVESGTVITLKYVKDENATKTLTYTVQYFKDSVEADKDTVTKSVWVNEPDTLPVDKTAINTNNKYTGYKFDSEKTGTIPTTVGNGATINVYYVKDESQTKDTIYTVRYTIEGAEQTDDTKTYTGKAWVLDDPQQIAIAEGGIPAPADKYTGYKLDEKNPAYPAAGTMVNSGSVYTVNYVKDESQTQPTIYTVHYTINGVEQEKDKLEVKGTAWVNDPQQIAIAEGGIPAPNDKYTGYKLADNNPEYPAAGTLVNTGAEYTVNYVKDEGQTNPTKYTVRHVVNGEEKASEEYTGKAWVNDSPAMIAIEAGSLDVNTYEGYKLDSITYADGKPVAADTKEVQTGTVITLTYIKDDGQTKGTSYTVKHIVAGVEQTDDTKTYTGTAWINDTNPTIAIEAGSLAQNTYTGYKFSGMSVADGTTEVASGTTITLTYIKDDGQTKDTSYTVKHVVAGVEQTADTKTYNSTAWVNDDPAMIAIKEGSLAQNTYTGYKFNGISVADGTTEVESGTTITLTYVKDENWTKTLTYTVRHVTVNNGEKVQDTQTYEKTVWVNDSNTIAIVDGSLAQNTYTGYKFDSIDIAEGTTEVENETVITLKYVVDWNQTKDLKYTVQYYKGDWLKESSTVTRENVWINTSDMMFVDKDSFATENKYEGYTFDRVDGPFGGTGNSYVKSGSTINVYYKPNTDTEYTVIHHYQNILNDGYDIDVERVTETFTGVTDTMTDAQPRNIPGFTLYGTISNKAIKGDGKSTVEIWYNRDKYTVTYQYEGFVPADATALPETVSYKHGATVSVAPKADAYGYTFSGWDKTGEFTMPMENVTITGSFEPIYNIKYTVKYVDEADNPVGRGTMDLFNGVFGETVTQHAPPVTGYKLLDESKETQSLVIGLNPAENVITFVYTKQSYTLTVNYVYAADGSEAASPVTQDFLYDTPYEVTSPVIPGYNVDQETVSGRMPYEDKTVIVTYTPRTDLTYIVNYLEEGTETVLAAPKTVANQTFGTQITETPVAVAGFVAPEAQTITIAVEDNVINFYYTRRTDLAYTVNYLEAGTGTALAAPATVAGQTFGSTVTVNPIAIAGYATPDAQTVTIAVTGNVVNFYYAAIPVIPGNPVVDIPPIPQLPENIDDEITPLDGPQVTVDDPETIDDEATPLAAGEHLCCILHFLILCAALLIELIYISDSKKRQQKIFEMRRELNK